MISNEFAWDDIRSASAELDLEPCALWAVCQVESAGSGFLEDGRPKILFEGHIFWRELKKRGLDPATYVPGNENVLYPHWTRQFYKGGPREYERLEKACVINRDAALASASWGAFQIMGFNHKACGFPTVEAFVEAMQGSQREQLRAACGFIRSNGMDKALRQHDWAGFALRYNGPGYKENRYDDKLRQAYERCHARHPEQ